MGQKRERAGEDEGDRSAGRADRIAAAAVFRERQEDSGNRSREAVGKSNA